MGKRPAGGAGSLRSLSLDGEVLSPQVPDPTMAGKRDPPPAEALMLSWGILRGSGHRRITAVGGTEQ